LPRRIFCCLNPQARFTAVPSTNHHLQIEDFHLMVCLKNQILKSYPSICSSLPYSFDSLDSCMPLLGSLILMIKWLHHYAWMSTIFYASFISVSPSLKRTCHLLIIIINVILRFSFFYDPLHNLAIL